MSLLQEVAVGEPDPIRPRRVTGSTTRVVLSKVLRAFVTLVRFDAAYHGLFKCNLRRLADYPRLTAYTARVHRLPGIAETVNIDHIKRGYYSIKTLNPSGIVPKGPALDYLAMEYLA